MTLPDGARLTVCPQLPAPWPCPGATERDVQRNSNCEERHVPTRGASDTSLRQFPDLRVRCRPRCLPDVDTVAARRRSRDTP